MVASEYLWVSLLLAAFGIVVPAPEFFGGLFLAIATAFLVMAFTPPDDRKAYNLTLACALLCAVSAVHLREQLAPTWSLHLVMTIGGGLSRFIVEAFLGFGRGFREVAGSIPGRLARRFIGKGDDDA